MSNEVSIVGSTVTKWEPIYRLTVTDPIQGGSDGISNTQPKQLADRTAYLKRVFTSQHSEEGTHCISQIDIAANAGIKESQLSLDVPLTELDAMSAVVDGKIAEIKQVFSAVFDDDTQYVYNLARRIQLSWKHSDLGFAFEFWLSSITMRDYNDQNVVHAANGDDSFNIPEDETFNLKLGQTYVLYDDTNAECVTVSQVLEDGRLLAAEDIKHEYQTSKLGHTSWDMSQTGKAIANTGGLYVSGILDVLEDLPSGLFAIKHKGGATTVSYKKEGASTWVYSECIRTETNDDDYVTEFYRTGGGKLQIRVLNSSSTFGDKMTVSWLALFPQIYPVNVQPILTPSIIQPEADKLYYLDEVDIEPSRYSSAYRDKYLRTEYRITNADGTIFYLTNISRDSVNTSVLTELEEDTSFTEYPVELSIQCRHVSDMETLEDTVIDPTNTANEMEQIPEAASAYGYSAWSEPVTFKVQGPHLMFGFVNQLGAAAPKSLGFTQDPEYDEGAEYNTLNTSRTYKVFGFVGAKNTYGFNNGSFKLPGN